MTADLEKIAATLEGSGGYRVLRRIPSLAERRPERAACGMRVGILLDCETTGLDADTDHIIELGMVRFEYGPAIGLGRVIGAFSGLHEPPCPIPREVTAVTGLRDSDVAGMVIADHDVEAFVREADLVIAHNAAFDRPFAERRWPFMARMDWGCSLVQVPWRTEGFEAMRLKLLLAESGYFHRGHRALDDASATLHLLSLPLPRSGRSAFDHLVAAARAPAVRIWALDAPFAAKDLLRRRGFRWSDGSAGCPRAWNLEVPATEAPTELGFLAESVYRGRAGGIAVPISPKDRFTRRAGLP